MHKVLVALLAALSTPVWATTTFPVAVQRELGLSKPVALSCALCHQNGVTAASTVVTPVALSLKARGIVANDEAKLRTALFSLRDDAVDSDGDGCTDVDELNGDTNPNVQDCGGNTGGGVVLSPPRYGCGAQAVPGLVFGAALLVLRLKRRRSA